MNILKKKPIIIMGSGHHVVVLINILKKFDREILGVTDPIKKVGEYFNGIKVLGKDDVIFNYRPNEIELVNGVAELQLRKLRYELSKKFERKGYTFSNIIHPYSIIEDKVEIGKVT